MGTANQKPRGVRHAVPVQVPDGATKAARGVHQMDIVSIAMFGGLGFACWLAYWLMQQMFGGKKDHDRSQFGGKNDGLPERKIDILGR